MPEKVTALKRRIAPSAELVLPLVDDDGAKFTRTFRLSFDFNAIALIEERTGLSLLNGEIWQHPTAKVLSIMLWAAILAHHDEYDSDIGLAVIRSYMDAGNSAAITRALSDAFIASLSKEQQEAARKKAEESKDPLAQQPKADAASAGSSAGPSPGTTSDSPIMNLDV